tara:strand:- start:52 stop:1017 length:966 start_codon:yes stop_codon:yes gene_type:complete
MRQHTKNIKSPLLARMQMEAGGSMGGICTAKVSEAEVMVSSGITDILIANQIVDHDKIIRLCSINKNADVKVCIDSEHNTRDISKIAQEQGVNIGVLIEVDTNMGRSGVRSTEQGVALAKIANELPGVTFLGIMSHQHLPEFTNNESRMLLAKACYDVCIDLKIAIEQAGISVKMISSGETFSYDAAVETGEPIEVEGGSYALMGNTYNYMSEFKIANKVLGTIVSTPKPNVAIGNVGKRALSWPGDDPSLEDMPGVTVDKLLDDHIVLKTTEPNRLQIGDTFLLLPFYQDMLINRWDKYIAVRGELVQGVWDIPARGCYH